MENKNTSEPEKDSSMPPTFHPLTQYRNQQPDYSINPYQRPLFNPAQYHNQQSHTPFNYQTNNQRQSYPFFNTNPPQYQLTNLSQSNISPENICPENTSPENTSQNKSPENSQNTSPIIVDSDNATDNRKNLIFRILFI